MNILENEMRDGPPPWEVLGVTAEATSEEVRRAYLEKLRQYPPDRAPEEFERIRDAYEKLSDSSMRLVAIIANEKPVDSVLYLLDSVKYERAFVGHNAWLAAIKEK